MIDINTLHIGSHVLIDGERRKVFGLGCDRVMYLPHLFSSIAESVLAEDVDPIPITEELLTELGFEKKMLPTFPPRPYYIDAESAKLKAEGVKLVEPRITISYAKVEFPFWCVEVYCEDMSDNRMAVHYLHELEQFLYLTTKTELINPVISVKPECLKSEPEALGGVYVDESLLDKDIKDLSATELRFLSENGYSVSAEIERRTNQKHKGNEHI